MTHDRRNGWRQAALALLLLLLGLGGGAVLRGWLADVDRPQAHTDGSGTTSFFKPEGLSADAQALWLRLQDILGMAGGRRFTFEKLAALLVRYRENAAAKAFGDAFLGTPELKALWEAYRRAGDEVDAGWLLGRLSTNQRFIDLLNAHARDRNFLAVSNAVTLELSAQVMQSGAAGVRGDAELFKESGPESAHATPAARGYRSLMTRAGAPAVREQETGTAAKLARSGPGADAHETIRLGSAKWDGGGRNTAAVIASLFTKLDKRERDRILPYLELGHGLEGSCRRAEATEACSRAIRDCRADPDCERALPAGTNPLGARSQGPQPSQPPGADAPVRPGTDPLGVTPGGGALEPPPRNPPGDPCGQQCAEAPAGAAMMQCIQRCQQDWGAKPGGP